MEGGYTIDETKNVRLEEMFVIAEGKIKEGNEKLQLEELKVFGTAGDELQITFYTFEDGHMEIYEEDLKLLFGDERTSDSIPQHTVLIQGEMARPISMPGNSLIRLEPNDGAEHGEPLDDAVVETLKTGSTSDVKTVFDQELKPFPEHQYTFLKVEVEPMKPLENENVKTIKKEPLSAASSGGRGSAKPSLSRLDGKDNVPSKIVTQKKVADKKALRVGPDVEVSENMPNVVHKKKSKEEKLKTPGVSGGGGALKPTPKKKSDKLKRPKSACVSPSPTPRDDSSMTSVARFSPRLKSLDEISHGAKPPTKKVKKSSSKTLLHVKSSSVNKTLVDLTTSNDAVKTDVPVLEDILPHSLETLPYQIPDPIPVSVKLFESVPAMPKLVAVRLPCEQAMVDIVLKSNKDVPRHQSLRIALQTFGRAVE